LELVLPVIHDANDGRPSGRGDFHQIQPQVLSHAKRGVDFQNAELRPICSDDANRTDTNLSIDSYALCGVLNKQNLVEKTKNADQKESARRPTFPVRGPSFTRLL